MVVKQTYVNLSDELTLNVKHLHVTDDSSSPTLVFLHDALGSIPQWKSFPENVGQKCGLNAIIYERPGHGSSSPLVEKRRPDYLHLQALDVLPALLKNLNIQKPILIGHSDGGSIALIYGAHFPVTAIVTIAAHIFIEDITLYGIQEAGQIASTLKPLLHKYHGEKTEALFDAWQSTWLSDDFMNWTIEKEIQQITSPVLAIQGVNDNYGTKKQVVQIVRQVAGPSKELIIQNAGHLPFLDQPELVSKQVSDFIRTIFE